MKPKHQEFINEYIRLKCSNATEAYQCVYPDCSYEAARRNASRLLTNADILAEIQRRVDAHTMSANEVLLRQAEIARSDIGEFLEQAEDGEVSVRLTDPKTNERKRTHLIKRITQRKVVRTIKDMTETETTLTLELHDAQAAQVQLGKHHKLWTERTELTGPNGGPIKTEQVNAPDLSKLTIDELRSLREMMSKAHDPADARSG